MTRRHLCVGGPLDRKFLEARSPVCRVPELEGLPTTVDLNPPVAVPFRYVTYIECDFHTPEGTMTFWVPERTSPLAVLQQLATSYQRARETPRILDQRCYRATVMYRRGDRWEVKPEAEALDGLSSTFLAGWVIEDGIYAGEWAMVPQGLHWHIAWIASGDLIDLREISP